MSWAPPITAFLARPEGAKAVAGWCGQPSRRFCTNLTSVEALLALSKSRIAAVWPQPGALRPWEPHETAHVVGEIGEANLHPRTGEADRPDNEAHQSLMREDMFDRRADLRFSRIGDS